MHNNSNLFPYIRILDVLYLERKHIDIKVQNKNCFVLGVRLHGSTSFFYNDKTITANANDIVYVPKTASYYQKCHAETIIAIHFDIIGPFKKNLTVFHENQTEFFKKIHELWSKKEKNYYFECLSILCELLSSLNFNSQKSEYASVINEAVEYINNNFQSESFSLDSACSVANISRVHLNRLFMSHFGITPITYINNLRIERAKQLLSYDYTTAEISSACGFNDIKYFYTVFKKVTNMTVKEYKKSAILTT